MPSTKFTYDLPPAAPSHVVREQRIEYGFIGELQNLKQLFPLPDEVVA